MVGYIGKEPVVGNFIKLDAITTSSTNTYNLLNGGVAYSPQSSRNCIVSLNGVIQSPDTAYTISGSQITFIPSAGTLSNSDVIDFILVLGDVLSVGTVTDNTVNANKLTTDAVTTAKIQNDAVTTDKILNDAVTEAKLNLISTSSVPSLEAKGDGSSDGYIKLNCSQNSHGITLKSPPHSANQNYSLVFPSTAPATDKFLKTDSSGNLSFADAGGGLVKITTAAGTGSSGIIDITGCFTSTYENYEIRGVGFLHGTAQVKFALLDTSGSLYGTYYNLGSKVYSNNSSTSTDAYVQWANNTFGLEQNHHDSTTRGTQFTAQIFQPRVSGVGTAWKVHQHTYDGNYFRTGYFMGGMNDSTEIAGIRIKTSGSINFRTQTKITVYGLV